MGGAADVGPGPRVEIRWNIGRARGPVQPFGSPGGPAGPPDGRPPGQGLSSPQMRTPTSMRVLDLEGVKASTLPNGLRVRVLPERSTPTVSYYTFFHVGSRNERLGFTGISHLFEHMMFNGAAKYGPKEFDRVLEARGGHSNAYTSTDLTAYYEDFASEALETVVDLESDRMAALRLTAEALEQEPA